MFFLGKHASTWRAQAPMRSVNIPQDPVVGLGTPHHVHLGEEAGSSPSLPSWVSRVCPAISRPPPGQETEIVKCRGADMQVKCSNVGT